MPVIAVLGRSRDASFEKEKHPDGAPLVSSIGAGDTGLTGYYCYKSGTEYDPSGSCNMGYCDPGNPAALCN